MDYRGLDGHAYHFDDQDNIQNIQDILTGEIY